MTTNPLISVIIPFLNAEKFLQEAIESVFTQTYENWELLLVDDGSTDASTVIAHCYLEQYPEKVCYLEHEGHQNLGVCASRNMGIYHAKGTYIALLDADDVWFPHKLEQQVSIMEAQPEARLVYGCSLYWQSWTGNIEDLQKDYLPELSLEPDTLYKPPMLLTLNHPLGKATSPCPSNILLHRDVIERVGGFEEQMQGIYQLFEDQAFLVKAYLNVPIFVSRKCWDKYRLHPDSCCSRVNSSGQHQHVRLFFLEWLEKYLSTQKGRNTSAWQSVQRELWTYRHPILYKLKSLTQKIL